MTAQVAELFEKAMQLPQEAREELAEAILDQSEPNEAYMAELLKVVEQRMENVRTGKSKLTPADEAHRSVREMLESMRR
jgi:exonuclease VII small subunit